MWRVQSLLPAEHEEVVTKCIDVGFTVHKTLGPGFRERIYERAYCLELDARGIPFESEKRIIVKYKEWEIPGQKLDLVVAGVVLVELKAVPRLRRIHRDQVISYLKTTGLRVGLMMNFNNSLFKHGLKRIAY
jgi:GxxExxY protein